METRELIWIEFMKWYGLKEIPGPQHNPTIVGWFKELGYSYIKDDETAWCSLAINIMAKNCNLEYTGKLDARSWLNVGVKIEKPKIGHVVVFYRGSRNAWTGHVGLFAGYTLDNTGIWTLGGNQNNEINISRYPVQGSTVGLLGFRELNYKK